MTKSSKYVINRLVIVDTNQRMDWTRVRIPTAPPQTHFESVCYTAKARWSRNGSTMRNPSTITGSNPVKCVFDGAELGIDRLVEIRVDYRGDLR